MYIFDLDDTIIMHNNNLVYENIEEDKDLSYLLKELNGKKYIYSNGTIGHVNKVITNMKLNDNIFEKKYARDIIPYMKPYIESFQYVDRDIKYINHINNCIFFDDLKENLFSAKKIGWKTVWINKEYHNKENYMDYSFIDLKTALIYFNKLDIIK